MLGFVVGYSQDPQTTGGLQISPTGPQAYYS